MTLRTITCAECPRMIVRAEGERSYPLCATCLSRPGWARDPIMRWVFAPRVDDAPERSPLPRRAKPRFGAITILAALMWSGVIGATLAQLF